MKSKLSSFWQWVKRHWKIIVPITVAVLLAIILGCSIPACIAAKPNGTYYKVKSNGELDREDYFTLKSGTWTDADGASGEYKKDGDRILFYIEFFGEKEVLAEGTLSNYVLSMEDENYISKKHKHRYGAWEKISEPTCVMDGKGERECACGVKETKIIKATHSTGDWIFDYTSHWKECTNCGKKVEEAAHFGDDKCKICNFPLVDTVGLSFTLNSKGNAYTVSGIGSVTDKIIRIPATYEGLPVVGIGDYAFKDELITQIIFPDSINSISDSAFSGCNNLQYNEYENAYYLGNANNPYLVLVKAKSNDVTTFTVNENTKLICDSAFSGCSSLTSITIPFVGESKEGTNNTHFGYIFGADGYRSNSSYVPSSLKAVTITGGESIGDSAFVGCSSLSSVTIGDSVTSIGVSAFVGCTSLTSITIPDSVTSIGKWAFSGCSSLASITIPFVGESKEGTDNTYFGYIFGANSYHNNSSYVPSSLKTVTITGGESIGSSAFGGCDSLTSITIPDSVTSIGEWAFSDCDSLTSINIPNGITSIEDGTFYYCDSLAGITIPDSVTSIGERAFSDCDSLTSINIPNSVSSIGDYAFWSCSKLTSITIPDSVTSIGYNAFSGCSRLQYNGSDNAYYLGNSTNPYLVLVESKSTNITSCTVNAKTKFICSSAFCGCSSLTSITIPDSVTSIGGSAFYGCSSLQYNESSNVCYLGNSTNPYLVLVKAKSTNITSCTVNENTRFIYDSAFYGCSSLTSITIPDSVTSIGVSAFYGCSSLTSITIPDSVTSIGVSAFRDCTSLTSITIPFVGASKDGTSNMRFGYIFGSNNNNYDNVPSSLKTVIVTGGESIGSDAFYGCSSLTSIIIPDSVTSIGSSAFGGCDSLTSIIIPDSVTSIGDGAFLECISLTSITIPDSVTSIGGSTFYYCDSLTSITIPDSVTSIGENAFRECSSLKSINFNGTKEKWKSIKKGSDWNFMAGNYTVHCTDGDIAKVDS